MRRLLCWLGWHRYFWVQFACTCELWVCPCGKVKMQFCDDSLALSEVEQMNAWLKRSEKNHVGR